MNWTCDKNYNKVCQWKNEQFSIFVQILPDEGYGIEEFGKFTNKNESGAIERPNPGHGEYRYFVPAESWEDLYEELKKSYSDLGAKRKATQVRNGMLRRAETYGTDWYWTYILVKVYHHGEQIGEGSCGGYESDVEQSYIDQQARGLVEEAVEDAVKYLKSQAELYQGTAEPIIQELREFYQTTTL